MRETVMADERNSASGVAWDLGDLYAGPDDPRLARDLDEAPRRARAFEESYRGKIASLGDSSAGLLFAAVSELEALSEQMDKPVVYAMLLHSARTDEPRHG